MSEEPVDKYAKFAPKSVPASEQAMKSPGAPPSEATSTPSSSVPDIDVDGQERGLALAQSLSDSNCHPVLMFGAASSGKTSVLLSLLRYMTLSEHAKARVSLDLNVLPSGGIWKELRSYAESLFNREAYEFLQARAADVTNVKIPFFVPIEIAPHKLGPRKFAFFEGQGEWFHPDFEKTNPHRPFKDEITTFLTLYTGPISVIYVAPFAVESYESALSDNAAEARRRLEERDYAMSGIINQYENLRSTGAYRDRHLFLFTKWDIRCQTIANPEFREYSEILETEIRAKYPIAYQRFENIHGSRKKESAATGAYCSGIITDKRIVAPIAKEDRPVVDLFARKLWDWLYFNSTQISLYPDVRPKPDSMWDKILKWMRK